MSIQASRPPEPRLKASLTCPACRGQMNLALVEPIMFSGGHEEVTYKCEKCGGEIKRSVKGHSY
jgi:C4-type Zn-finger protein